MSWHRWGTNQTFASTADGDMITKIIPGSLVIPAGVTITVSNRCKGLHLQIMGDLFLYGTISMTARGANVVGNNVGIEIFNDRNTITFDGVNYSSLPTIRKIPSVGANGGAACGGVGGKYVATGYGGNAGSAGSDGQTGGGGSGECWVLGDAIYGYNQPAGPGTSYSGGPGSGGTYSGAGTYGGSVGANGGAGGSGYTSDGTIFCGGGAGNPGGAGSGNTPDAGDNGTGGLLIIVVLGHCYIHSTGIINANGSEGGLYYGGGSGGGSVNLLYGSLTNNGTIQANGGAGGLYPGSGQGGNGGAGSVRKNSLRAT